MLLKFELNESLYLKDPQETDLGRRILKNSILLINEIGFESFTFKKLALKIASVEKSIYRYFDNKHKLLLFLTSWYWEWVHYLIKVNIAGISVPSERLSIAIENIVYATSDNASNPYINEALLHQLIINEGMKAYHTCMVDDENKLGLFFSYKDLVQTVSNLMISVNPRFKYPTSLASNIFEMANNQSFFALHMPRLTDLDEKKDNQGELIEMLNYFAFTLLKAESH